MKLKLNVELKQSFEEEATRKTSKEIIFTVSWNNGDIFISDVAMLSVLGFVIKVCLLLLLSLLLTA